MKTRPEARDWNLIHKAGLTGLLLIWFAGAYVIGAEQLLANEQHLLVAPIAISAAIPVAAFLAIYALSPRFRAFVLSQDIEALTMLQHWRVVGFAFLPLTFFGVLPGLFAWPAGLGDVAIGLTAPLVVARLNRDPDYSTSPRFLWFHLLGLLDFAVAIVTAGLAAGAFPGLLSDGVTSAPLDVWPLNLFPSFIVPVFIILHLTVFLKVRHLRRSARHPVEIAVGTA